MSGEESENEPETLDLKLFALPQRYGTSYERTFFKALETLQKLQRERFVQSKPDFVSQKAEQASKNGLPHCLCQAPSARREHRRRRRLTSAAPSSQRPADRTRAAPSAAGATSIHSEQPPPTY